MSRKNGYILLWKQITDPESWVWSDKPFARGQAWIDLLLKANFKDVTTTIKGQTVTIKRGQVLRSEDTLANDWGWSRGKVRRFLKSMEKSKMCTLNGTAYGTLITIENYEHYQDERPSSGTANGTSDGTADGTGMKEGINKDKEEGAFERPSTATVFSFFQEHNYISDPEAFLDWYDASNWKKKNGQPISDWKSAAKAWERREKSYESERKNVRSNVPVQPEPPKPRFFGPPEEHTGVQMDPEQRKKLEETKQKLMEAIT